jgi:hypothetical protein
MSHQIPARLLGQRVPPEVAQERRRKLRKAAKKRGSPLSQERLQLCDWTLVVTNAPPDLISYKEAFILLGIRWQIELLFKRMKQMLNMHPIQSKRQDSVQATIRALLVAWVLQEQQAAQVRSLLHQLVHSALSQTMELPVARPISSWSVSKLCLQTLRQQVLGQWSMARLRACLPRLQRFLTSKRRKRGHQESDVRQWLQRRSIGQSQPLQLAA